MRSVALAVLLTLTLTLTLAACGGEDQDEQQDGLGFSLDSSRSLGSLSTTELETICGEEVSFYEQSLDLDARCYAMAALMSTGAQQCQTEYQHCLKLEYGVDFGYDCMASSPKAVKGCQATVEDLSRCTNELVQIMKQVSQQVCNVASVPTSAPICAALQSKCPSL